MEQFLEMARGSFGFGTWDGPYWFIGPEQGMSKDDSELATRYAAWEELGKNELDDCLKFHEQIKEQRWHGKHAQPQKTWTRLISVLIGYGLESVTDRLSYQKNQWGRRKAPGIDATTCVIELSGIPAYSLGMTRDRLSHLDDRLNKIASEIKKNAPVFVVLYGRTAACKTAWNVLTAGAETLGTCSSGVVVRRSANTLFAWATHPADFGQSIEQWRLLGQELRDLVRDTAKKV